MRIQRRILVRVLATGFLAATLVAAQPAATMPRIGYLGVSSPSLEPHYVEAFRQTLRDLGYVEGQSVAIEYRWAEGQDARLARLAAELVATKVDVIVTTGTLGTLAAKSATHTIPIVMASSGDPVRSGLVASLAHPGGNVTGFTIFGPELEAKRLELLREAVPRLSRAGVLWNPANPAVKPYYETIRLAASTLQVTLDPVVEVSRPEELDKAFSTITRVRPQALASTWTPEGSCPMPPATSTCFAAPRATWTRSSEARSRATSRSRSPPSSSSWSTSGPPICSG
jgi:putative ABC transport system substrate-binding protein